MPEDTGGQADVKYDPETKSFSAVSKMMDYQRRSKDLALLPAILYFEHTCKLPKDTAANKECKNDEKPRKRSNVYEFEKPHSQRESHVMKVADPPRVACLTPHWRLPRRPERLYEHVLAVLKDTDRVEAFQNIIGLEIADDWAKACVEIDH